MILKAIEYALSSKPAGQGSEYTDYDKRMDMLNKKGKPIKGHDKFNMKEFNKFKKRYHENSKSRKVMGDIT